MSTPEDGPPQMPIDAILAEDSVAAGVAALERIHGRHLADMTPEEQADARNHWREQVEEVLTAVRSVHASPFTPGAGRAVLTFVDVEVDVGDGEADVDVSVSCQPELEELPDGEVTGTPAQMLALTALQMLQDEERAE